MDSSSEWHSESKEGALMINQYQKDTFDFDTKIKMCGKDIIQAEEMENDDKSAYVKALQSEGIDIDQEQWDTLKDLEDDDSDIDEQEHLKSFEDLFQGTGQFKNGSKMSLQQQRFSTEVDFEMFEKQFWHKNKGNLKLSAINVWTEIISVIKGGINSIRLGFSYYHYGICSKKVYMRNLKSSMDYINEYEKMRIYMLYVRYENWKNENHFYDFMDVVRHVIRNYPYKKKFNVDYLVVDEVQDLTPLTIQLFIGVTNKNIFF